MPLRKHLPTRTLQDRPDLSQLKRQAKELLKTFASGDAAAIAEVESHYHGATAATFALHDAQLVLARAYGFDSWPKLKAYVDGVTVRRLVEAVRAGDIGTVTSMLSARPELVHLDVSENDEHRALHHAVLQRQPEIVRLLMQRGADARKGIWPHRDATSALTIAAERGYQEIVEVIRQEEAKRSAAPADFPEAEVTSELIEADRTARRAVATGDIDWLRARHAERTLLDDPGLVSVAVEWDQPEILIFLLGVGLDPDQRERVSGLEDSVYSWGGPLRLCARTGKAVMAEILLKHKADPNTNVYAASSAMYEALARHDARIVQLLEKHGGIVNATTAAFLGLADRVRQLFEDERAGRLPYGAVSRGNVAEDVLEAALDGGHVDLVRMALDHLDWKAGDERWQGMLMRPFGKHEASVRERYIACFRMIIDRSGIDLPWRFGRTSLHDVAADWPRSAPMGTEERLAFATILLEKGARIDARDDLLKSTPLGWACRWGRLELVNLLLARGADPIEADAERWATPRAWAEKMNYHHVLAALQKQLESGS